MSLKHHPVLKIPVRIENSWIFSIFYTFITYNTMATVLLKQNNIIIVCII